MNYHETASLLKIIADPSRLEILDLLSCDELCGYDLLEHFEFSQPTLSHHMKVLVNSNFVTKRKDGNKVMYELNHEVMHNIENQLQLINSASEDCACQTMKKGVC
ncbi:ArsR family transcriptional regulator [Jeotgalicoccus nanhaiensis]|uniref:Winged helix-turn-helix transcriptional regulator n=1 Tax=Jeotgalicoccus nanhaiensis TaxID=568603 RepID=A0ABR9XYG8_9STAP|nr:metalloregulator ArsR/SmtB family transcription factor [Jeotgalicoccus nanhaiensis]MBF0753780.1 winged helix-turn-helix transcriptional regulator [Jeotgalicoccus nanhaiensis]TFU61942.1 ArsR family transcriptional regulator [Jeotgalicoccus nanhaiensis]